MSGKTAGGLVLIVVGVVLALWGLNYMSSLGSQLANAVGMHDNTGPIAIGAGIAVVVIGLAVALSKSKETVQ
jgi:amino acid permease